MSDMSICLTLTAAAILANAATSIRAVYYARKIEDCRWLCRLGNRHCSMQILIGFAIICIILAMLKAWSIQDVFLDEWYNMSHTYHIRSYAYLAENFGVAILGWKVTTYIKVISGCRPR